MPKLLISISEETLKNINDKRLFLNPRDIKALVNEINKGVILYDNATNYEVAEKIYGHEIAMNIIKSSNIDIEFWTSSYKNI